MTPEPRQPSAGINRYRNYQRLSADLRENRAETKKGLKAFFVNLEKQDPELAHAIVKTIVHGLAEPDLKIVDAHLFQALLYSKPEFSNTHLIGGLNVTRKDNKAAGEDRVKRIKRLLTRGQFAKSQTTANNLIAALNDPEQAEHAKEILAHQNYATQQTANNLIAALNDPEIAEHAKEILAHQNYATQQTANNLIAALNDPEQAEHAKEILAHVARSDSVIAPLTVSFLVGGLGSRHERINRGCIEVLQEIAGNNKVRHVLRTMLSRRKLLLLFEGNLKAFSLKPDVRAKITKLLEA